MIKCQCPGIIPNEYIPCPYGDATQEDLLCDDCRNGYEGSRPCSEIRAQSETWQKDLENWVPEAIATDDNSL